MQAVVTYGFGDAAVEDVPAPSPEQDEVLIEVSRVQLSITECDLFRGTAKIFFDVVEDRLDGGDGARLFGHEFCGIVRETGADVAGFEAGDRVYPPGKVKCGTCAYCRAGMEQHCPNTEIIGRHFPGALAEYVTVPADLLAPLPDDVSDAEGATMQPIHSAFRLVHDAGIRTGDTVAVLGTGVMGSMSGQFALEQGAGEVFAIDIDPRKLEIASDRGMTPIDAREGDGVEAVLSATDDVGADVVFEAIGGEQSDTTAGSDPLAQALRMVRRGGTMMQVGHPVGNVEVDPAWLRAKGVTWTNPSNDPNGYGSIVDTRRLVPELIAADRVSIEEYLTHELDGLGAFEEAVDITLNKPDHGALAPAQLVLK